MDLKNLDLEVTIKDGKITAKVDSAGLKADVAVDLNAINSEVGGAPVIFQQLAAIAMGLGQGLQQAARMGGSDDDDDGGDGGDEDEAEPPARKDAATATQ